MRLPLSSPVAPISVLDSVGSTNDELRGRAGAADFTVVLTTNQTAGRGRLGREWIAPPGKTLAVSVLLRPVAAAGAAGPAGQTGAAGSAGDRPSIESFGWLPLIAGVAMAEAVEAVVAPDRTVSLKWPNDVLIDGKKVCGILSELTPNGDAVVVGAGVNLTLAADELPVPTATSLVLEGAPAPDKNAGDENAGDENEGEQLLDRVLSRYLTSLRAHVPSFWEHGGDAVGSGILSLVERWCGSIGTRVRVQLPGGGILVGTATGIDLSGRLVVRADEDGRVQAVAAGDVTHLRYE